jgi:hypothetical protein
VVVIGQLHASASLLPEKQPLVPVVYEAEWDPEPVWMLWSTEKSLSPAWNRTPAVQLVGRRYMTMVHIKRGRWIIFRKSIIILIDYGILIQSLTFWALFIVQSFVSRQGFGDWTLPPSSGKSLLSWSQSTALNVILNKNRTMDNVEK